MESSTKKIIFLVLVLCIIAGLLMLTDSFGWLKRLKNSLYLVVSPFQKIFSSASIKANQTVSFFFNIKQIVQENHKLRAENLDLISQLAQYNDLFKENETLRQALNFQQSSGQKLTMARIISQSNLGDRRVIMIDKGTNHGIFKGMPVVVPPDILVGKVIESSANFSFFLPLVSYQSQIQAVVQNTDTPGILKGQDSRLLLMDMIPQDKELGIGDLVVAVSNLNMSTSLLVGQIEEIIRTDLGVFQKALVKPLVDLSNLDLVAVIITGSSNL